jgi:endonuclease G
LKFIEDGNPLAAEYDERRLRSRLQAKAGLAREEAEAIALGIRAYANAAPAERAELTKTSGPEAIWGKTIDFLAVSFLERGAIAARAVARIAYRDGRPQGSGFLVAPGLLLTNHHVISSAAQAAELCVEFEYELDPADRPRGVTRFAFAAERLFVTDPVNGLDYSLVAVGDRLSGTSEMSRFGFCPLSDRPEKHALGEVANVIQHPDGRYKEVVLRENQFVARLDDVLHYIADTEPGSSGSPVFNNEWEPVALHHWGGPWRQRTDARGRELNSEINEGIRISAIIASLRTKQNELGRNQRSLVQSILQRSERASFNPPHAGAEEPKISSRLLIDGSIAWQIPLEISVRLPAMNGAAHQPAPATPAPATEELTVAERIRPSKTYADRSGYKPRFIQGFTVDLPRLSKAQQEEAARNLEANPGDDPFELKYHHFSIVMNGVRRLAFFTACNIDGSKAKHVDRDTGQVTELDPEDPRLESLAAEGMEGSETWFDDMRVAPGSYAGREVYEQQVVRGFPNTRSMGRTLRMFQRGHLVRRMDPAWGTEEQAKLADADTFHWTNCSPQVGFFNMGRAAPGTPSSGGGKLWRALENYVLRNSVAENARVSCFTGPVFTQRDRKFRGIGVPGRFWKVVVWAEAGELRALAMIADQRPVIEVWPEALEQAPEAFGDADELAKVEDFVVPVREVERLTGLDFGDVVRSADVHSRRSTRVVHDSELPLSSRSRRATARSGAPRKAPNEPARKHAKRGARNVQSSPTGSRRVTPKRKRS